MLLILERAGTIGGAKTLGRREKMEPGPPMGSGLSEGAGVDRVIDEALLKALFSRPLILSGRDEVRRGSREKDEQGTVFVLRGGRAFPGNASRIASQCYKLPCDLGQSTQRKVDSLGTVT